MHTAPPSGHHGLPSLYAPEARIGAIAPPPPLGIVPATWVCGAVLLGCMLGPTRHAVWPTVLVLGVVACALAAWSRFAAAWIVACMLLAFALALWRAAPSAPRAVEWPSVPVNEVKGVATAWPVTTSAGTYVRVPLHVTTARTKTDWVSTDATFVAILPSYPTIGRGDALFVIGTPRLQANTESDGTLFATSVRIDRVNTERKWEDIAHAITAGLRGRIEMAVRSPESGLIVGMLLGEKSALDIATRDAMSVTGTTHFIVIDGGSVALMAGLIAAVGRALGTRERGLWTLVSLAGIIAYALVLGTDPPVVRAVTMGAIALLAPLLGRRADPLVSLGIAAAGMALWEPAIVTSLSFLVSLAATFGVIGLTPWVHHQMERVTLAKNLPHLTEMAAVSVAVYVMTEPIIWHAFGQVSPIAPVVNVLLEPIAPPIMALGAAASALALLPLPLPSQAVGGLAAVPAWLFLQIVHLGAALPLAGMRVPQPGVSATIACYVIPAVVVLVWKGMRARHDTVTRPMLGWSIGGFAVTFALALALVLWKT